MPVLPTESSQNKPRQLGGDLLHILGEVIIFTFANESSGTASAAASGGKEDEVRGETDPQCVAACRCGLEMDGLVAQWAERRQFELGCHTAVAVGELQWTHVSATVGGSNYSLGQSRRTVLAHGSALETALELCNQAASAAVDEGKAHDAVSSGLISEAVRRLPPPPTPTHTLANCLLGHSGTVSSFGGLMVRAACGARKVWEPISDSFATRSVNVGDDGQMLMTWDSALTWHLPPGVRRVLQVDLTPATPHCRMPPPLGSHVCSARWPAADERRQGRAGRRCHQRADHPEP